MLRYVDNPNGSVDDIAGICNEGGNVVGLMPHPERASDPLLGSVDGSVLLRALLASAGASDRAAAGGCGAGQRLSRRTGRRPGRARRPAGPAGVVQLRVRGILACWRTEALTPTVRQAE